MIPTDMLLTTIILIGCMSILAESAVTCPPGDKKETVTIMVEFMSVPRKSTSFVKKTVTSHKTFRSSLRKFAKSSKKYDSSESSVSASVGFGGFSASVGAAFASATSSASSLSTSNSNKGGNEEKSENEETGKIVFFKGENQVRRVITTTINIGGKSSVTKEDQIVFSTPSSSPLTPSQLRAKLAALAKKYISNRYSDAKGEISGNGNVFSQSQCYTPAVEPSGQAGCGVRAVLNVQVTTCNEGSAGTTSSVYRKIKGTLGETDEMLIDNPGTNLGVGNTVSLVVNDGQNIGDFNCVSFRMVGDDGWKVGKVKAFKNSVLVWSRGNIDTYIDNDGSLEICRGEYTISVKIRNNGEHDGTTNNQYVRIKGTKGTTTELQCSADFDSPGSTASCTVSSFEDIGQYRCVIWRTTGTDGWVFTELGMSIDGVAQTTYQNVNGIELDDYETKTFCIQGE